MNASKMIATLVSKTFEHGGDISGWAATAVWPQGAAEHLTVVEGILRAEGPDSDLWDYDLQQARLYAAETGVQVSEALLLEIIHDYIETTGEWPSNDEARSRLRPPSLRGLDADHRIQCRLDDALTGE